LLKLNPPAKPNSSLSELSLSPNNKAIITWLFACDVKRQTTQLIKNILKGILKKGILFNREIL
jgi:hypothetical protein